MPSDCASEYVKISIVLQLEMKINSENSFLTNACIYVCTWVHMWMNKYVYLYLYLCQYKNDIASFTHLTERARDMADLKPCAV